MTEKTKQKKHQGIFDMSDLEKEIGELSEERLPENWKFADYNVENISRSSLIIWEKEAILKERQRLKAEVEKVIDSLEEIYYGKNRLIRKPDLKSRLGLKK